MDYDEVSASYARCLESDGFLDTFYEVFLAKSDEIPPLFSKTDFVRQKETLADTIPYLLVFATGKEFGREILANVAEIHSRKDRNIDPKFYPLWLESLCESIEKHDADWTPELNQQWRAAMKRGIDFMIAAY